MQQKYKNIVVFRLILIVLLSCVALNAMAEVVHIGLRAHSGVEKGVAQWQPTADYLTAEIPGYEFEIVPYVSIKELNKHAGQGEFDFVLTNPSSYVDLEINHHASRMLTLINKRQGGPYTQFGSVIIARADSNINDLSNLKDKRFMAVSEKAFGGWLVTWRELQEYGINPDTFFSELLFSSGVQEEVVYAVRDGRADAGTVRTDMLERMVAEGEIDLGKFKVINPEITEGFPFLHSSRLYPEWPFSKFHHTPRDLAKKVVIALLSMPETDNAAISGKYIGWTVPLDYSSVHELLKELKVGAYSNYGDINLVDFIDQYRYLIMVFFSLLVITGAALFYVVIAGRRQALVQSELKKSNDNLIKRITELDCIYKITAVTGGSDESFVSKLRSVVNLIPPAWHRAEIAHARIIYNDLIFESDGFKKLECKMSNNLIIDGECLGYVEIYSESLSGSCDILLIDEERAFLSEITARLVSFIKRELSEKILKNAHSTLELRVKTRTQELEEALRDVKAANDAKSEFLSRMTHELRTPMNAILGYSQLMDSEYDEQLSAENKSNIHEIISAGNHLLSLINDILELQILESGKYDLDMQVISVSSCIDGALGILLPILDKRGVTLVNELIEPGDYQVMADPIRLKQIILNLISNAVKFNQPGGTVTLKYRQSDTVSRLIVADTGCGIDPVFHEKLFDPFVRISRLPYVEGSGIGLSVTKSLVEAMGGRIGLNSEVGVGSEFWVELKCVS